MTEILRPPLKSSGTKIERENSRKKINGRHEETRTPDLYRVKVAL